LTARLPPEALRVASFDDDTSPLPLPPLAATRPADAARQSLPPAARVRQAVLGNLPLFLMALLAGLTWWLVQQTPEPEPERGPQTATHDPDYEMHGFSVQHYQRTGPARGVIEGAVVRHFPDTDTLEIDGLRMHWRDDAGHLLSAQAARARAQGDGSEVRLMGGATVVRDALPGEMASLQFTSEEMVFDRRQDQVRSDRPVVLRQGDSVVEARSLIYSQKDAVLELQGAVRGRLPVRR
jgi:lipopolysaccharide export system protein LptC